MSFKNRLKLYEFGTILITVCFCAIIVLLVCDLKS
jgi:hypothetical protein